MRRSFRTPSASWRSSASSISSRGSSEVTDEAGQFSSAITLNGNRVLTAGTNLVVADVAAANLSVLKTAWGLSDSTAVVSVDGPSLGKENDVVLFDKLGNVAVTFNYDLTAVLASDGTLITTASASGGKTFSDGQHAGAAYGAGAAASRRCGTVFR